MGAIAYLLAASLLDSLEVLENGLWGVLDGLSTLSDRGELLIFFLGLLCLLDFRCRGNFRRQNRRKLALDGLGIL